MIYQGSSKAEAEVYIPQAFGFTLRWGKTLTCNLEQSVLAGESAMTYMYAFPTNKSTAIDTQQGKNSYHHRRILVPVYHRMAPFLSYTVVFVPWWVDDATEHVWMMNFAESEGAPVRYPHSSQELTMVEN